MNKFYLILIFIFFGVSILNAQEILTKDEAVKIALDSNYSIKIAKNNLIKAENNASIYNSDYLPKLILNSGASINNNSFENEFQDGTGISANGANSGNINASLTLSYTIYDGNGRAYNYKKLKEMYNLSDLEAESIIENSLINIFIAYYDVAANTEAVRIMESSMEISDKRLQRAKYKYEYGKSTKLDVLNSEVDFNNDKIRLLSARKLLSGSKNNLNLLLGRPVGINFSVDTIVEYVYLKEIDSLISVAKQNNINVRHAQKNLEINNILLKENKTGFMPVLDVYGAYAYNSAYNDENYTYAYTMTNGINAGVSLKWNIFDGGRTKTAVQNAKLNVINAELQKLSEEQTLERDIRNLWEAYNNALFVLDAESKNVFTNSLNFSRTEEQFKLGQVSSIEYRQAQLNLLNAQLNYNKAKYDAKVTELQLLKLTGQLMDSKF